MIIIEARRGPCPECSLRVADLDSSAEFYRKLFGAEPAKRRPGYANFAIIEPPLKLVLIEGEPGQATVMDHLGVEVESTEQVHAATTRLSDQGLDTTIEDATLCCYALQNKVWVRGPGAEPWEVYTVIADAPEATSIHPLGAPDSGECVCGTPSTTLGEPLSSCC